LCGITALQRSQLAGDALDLLLLHQLSELGHTVKPRYAISRRVVNDQVRTVEIFFDDCQDFLHNVFGLCAGPNL
jgi:hypothetical protein